MAVVWTVVISASALTVSYFQYRNERSLYKITETVGDVEVIRDGKAKKIPHQDLVPGDVITISDGTAFCDMVIVSSRMTLVDESALTGEANPVGKTALDATAKNDEYSQNRHKRHTLLAGTTVVEVDNARAIVTQTASFTARGELIRDIYSYKRHQFKFDIEVPIVITILFFYAIFGFMYVSHCALVFLEPLPLTSVLTPSSAVSQTTLLVNRWCTASFMECKCKTA
jgi:P-type E1-E2 ATPase